MAKSYREVLDAWERAKAFGYGGSLKEYAQKQNALYGTQDYSAAEGDNWLRRGSTYLDQALEATGVPKVSEEVLGGVGSVFGAEDVGRAVGRGLPRSAINMLPLLLGGPIGALGTGALMGLNTYADTGSAKAGLISGAAGAAMPAFGKVFGNAAARLAGAETFSGKLAADAFGKQAGEFASEVVPTTGTQRLAQYVGGQVGGLLPNTAAAVAQQRTLNPGQPFDWKNFGVETLLSQIPFTAYDAVRSMQAPKITRTQAEGLFQKETKAPAPEYHPPAATEEERQNVAAVLDRMYSAANGEDVEDRSSAVLDAIKTVGNPEVVQAEKPAPAPTEVFVSGYGRKTANGGWKVFVEDAQSLGEHGLQPGQTIFVNGAEPTKAHNGQLIFQTDTSKISSAVKYPLKREDFVKTPDPNQPELPQRQADVPPTEPLPKIEPDEQQVLVDMGVKPETIVRLVDTQSKSENPILDLFQGPIQKDAAGNVVRLGNTDVGAGGWMNRKRFEKATQLPKEVLAALPEGVFRGDEVNAGEAVKALEGMVQVRRISVHEGETSKNEQELARIQHELDTRFPGWNVRGQSELQPEESQLVQQRRTLRGREQETASNESATARFSSVNPYDPPTLRGEKEVAPGHRITWAGDIVGQTEVSKPTDEQSWGIKFQSQHYPSDAGQNQLFFLRGALHEYELGAKLPDGTAAQQPRKIFEVWEVQSDWAGEAARAREDLAQEGLSRATGEEELLQQQANPHPLLPLWESLALRTAIIEARKMGADAIAVSDAQSAMMTEGHDKAAQGNWAWVGVGSRHQKPTIGQWGIRRDDGVILVAKSKAEAEESLQFNKGVLDQVKSTDLQPTVSQSPGMTAAYDERLPAALQKLTGEKGRPGVMAEVHQNATSEITGDVSGSPVFREGGKAKVTNTARVFSLEKIAGGLEQQDTLSIKEAVQRYEQAQEQERRAKEKASVIPQTAPEVVELLGQLSPEQRAAMQRGLAQGMTSDQAMEIGRLVLANREIDAAQTDANAAKAEVDDLVKPKATFQGKIVKSRGRSLVDEKNRRYYFKSESEAHEWLDNYRRENQWDTNPWDVATGQDRGKGKYYIGQKAEVVTTSLDAARSAEGGTLHNAIADQMAQADIQREELFDAVAERMEEEAHAVPQAYLDSLDAASRNPRVFANEAEMDLPDAILALRQAKVAVGLATKKAPTLEAVNAALKDAGVAPFESLEKMTKTLQQVKQGADAFRDTYRNFTLGSSVPHDEALVSSMDIRDKGLVGWMDWFEQKGGVMGDLLRGLRGVIDPAKLELVLPGDVRHDAKGGWYYTPALEGEVARINVGRLPSDENSAIGESLNLTHELAHHAGRELLQRDDPSAQQLRATLRETLDAIRQSPNVPKKVRNVVARATVEGWFKDHRSGKLSGEELFAKFSKALGTTDATEWMPVIYGMSDEHELLAQVFGAPEMVMLLRSTKMPKTTVQTVLDFFSSAWNRIFKGRAESDNALSQVLLHFDNYLGNKTPRGYGGMDYLRDGLVAAGTHPEALASRLETARSFFSTGNLQHSLLGFQREMTAGILPVTAKTGELDTLVRQALSEGQPGDVGKTTMLLLADQLDVHQELYQRMRQDYDLVTSLVSAAKKKTLNVRIPEGAEKALAASGAKLNAMQDALRRQANAVAAWQGTYGLTVEGWEQNLANQLAGVPLRTAPDLPEAEHLQRLVGLEKLQKGSQIGLIPKALGLTVHMKEAFPALKPGINAVANEQAEAVNRATVLNVAFTFNHELKGPDGRGSLDKNIMKAVNRVAANETLSTATSDLLRWQNLEGKARSLDMQNAFVRKTLGRLNERDRKDILTTINAIAQRHTVWSRQILPEAVNRMNVANTAQLIAAKETGILPEQARELAQEVYAGLAQLVNPETSGVGMERLRVLSARMQPGTYTTALQHAQTLAIKLRDKIEQVQKYPGWVTEQRYGKDHLVLEGPNGEPFRASGNREELLRIQQKKSAEGWKFIAYERAEDAANPTFGMKEDFLRQIEDLDSANVSFIQGLPDLDPEVKAKLISEAQRGGDLRATLAANQPLPAVSRRFVEGREYINMLDNSNQFYTRMNNWLRNRLTRAEVGLEMYHPDIATNPELRKYLQQHMDNFLSPDNPTARKVVEATYFAKLGFDVGQSLIESTQHLTTGLAELISETGSVTDAIELLGKTTKALWKRKVTGRWDNEEHNHLATYLAERGHSGLATWHEIADPDTNTVLDANRGAAGSVVGAVKNGAKRWSSMFSRYNDQVIAHAAYDLARAQGMEFTDAAKFAVDVKNRGLYTVGKAGRAVGLWSIKSKPVPQLLAALQNYTLGWFGQMASNYSKGFGKNPPAGLTAQQRLGAKKAFAYSLVAQAALAGGLGLPGVGQGLALFSQITGLDAKGYIRKELQTLFDEDQEYGGVVTGLAMRGVGSAGLPFDPSNRTSISIPFIGVDAYEGFNASRLVGASANTLQDIVEGLVAAAKGDSYDAAKLLPNALKRPYQLWQGEGDIRDRRGGLMYTLSPTERALQAIGLQPSRVQAAKDTGEAIRQLNDRIQKQMQSQTDTIATLLRNGNVIEAQTKILELKQSNPDMDMKSLLQTVARRVEAQSYPYDPRRDLNVGADISGLGVGQAPSEQSRRQTRVEAQKTLGLRVKPNLRADRTAASLDQIMAANPYLSRAEAVQISRETGLGRHRSSTIELPDYLR